MQDNIVWRMREFARKHEGTKKHESANGKYFRAFVLSCFRAFVLSCFFTNILSFFYFAANFVFLNWRKRNFP